MILRRCKHLLAKNGTLVAVNEDGTANSSDAPAQPGSAVSIQVTGVGALDGNGTPVMPSRATVDDSPASIESFRASSPGVAVAVIRFPMNLSSDAAQRRMRLTMGDGVAEGSIFTGAGGASQSRR